MLQDIDHSAIFTSQVTVVILNILAFILNLPWLAALVALAMLAGAAVGKPGFGVVYQFALKPAGLLKPHLLADHPEPHRFAQALGGSFVALGVLALLAGSSTLGWGLVWLVAGLSALNAFGGFCVGCFMYYWLARLGAPGFRQAPPPGTLPGMRPKGAKTEVSHG